MRSLCINCIIRPFEKYILISKFFITKCIHSQNNVHLEYAFSLKHTLLHIIFCLGFIVTVIQTTIELKSDPSMEPTKYWFLFVFETVSLSGTIICTSFLITNRDRFDLYYLINDILSFAKRADLQILKQKDLNLLNKHINYMNILTIFNPLYISWLYFAFFQSENALFEINIIFMSYMASCFGFYSIILTTFFKMCLFNFKSYVNKFLCNHKRDNFEIKIQILKKIMTKVHHLNKKIEDIYGPIAFTVALLTPIIFEIILINIQVRISSSEFIGYAYILRELNLLYLSTYIFVLFCIVLRRIQFIKVSVSLSYNSITFFIFDCKISV